MPVYDIISMEEKTMKRKNIRFITAVALVMALAVSATGFAFADSTDSEDGTLQTAFGGWFGGQQGTMPGRMGGSASYASEPSEIVTSSLTSNSAEELSADLASAETIVMSDSNNSVKISKAGTYIVTGTCSNGNLAVKKGTTGVVLILKDLDLTSTVGATVSLNKGTEVKVIIQGTVKLTDNEDLADEESDDFDGAALKAKAGSSVVLTGDGTLIVNGNCKNGIKVSDLEDDDKAAGYTEASFIIDDENLTIKVTAANDGINSGTDLTIKSGNITVSAADDGVKADYILTIGEEGTAGPVINVAKSKEGIEGATINIYSGAIDVTASDDGINAANSDLTGYTYSLNIIGGTINISAGSDGIDSNGNVNIIGGLTTILKSANNGGNGGLDFDGSGYVKDGCLVNPYGTTMDSGKGGMGGMNGQRPGRNEQGDGSTDPRQSGQWPWSGQKGQDGMSGQKGQRPGMNGQTPDGQSEATPDNGTRQGQMPQDGQQPPEIPQDGQESPEAPQDGQQPAPENTEASEDQQLNWFQRLIRTIIGWFTKDISR